MKRLVVGLLFAPLAALLACSASSGDASSASPEPSLDADAGGVASGSSAPPDGVHGAPSDPERDPVAGDPDPAAPDPDTQAEPDTQAAPDPDTPFDRAASLPRGVHADVASLCASQRAAAAATVAHARDDFRERGEPMDLRASCKEDGAALPASHVHLAPPFLEAKAITYESGYATETALALRTDAGWVAMALPLLDDEHDDPGCPSILRETRIDEVRVDHGTLVVLTTGGRGAGDAEEVISHARACRLGDDAVTCDEPVTVEVRLVPWSEGPDAPPPAAPKRIFHTAYRVDGQGAIAVDRAWSDPLEP